MIIYNFEFHIINYLIYYLWGEGGIQILYSHAEMYTSVISIKKSFFLKQQISTKVYAIFQLDLYYSGIIISLSHSFTHRKKMVVAHLHPTCIPRWHRRCVFVFFWCVCVCLLLLVDLVCFCFLFQTWVD